MSNLPKPPEISSLPTNTPSVSSESLNNNTISLITKITEYSPYICIILSILLIISIIINLISGDSSDESQNNQISYNGNKGLDTIWKEAEGEKVSSNAILTSQLNISTDEYSCKYDIQYGLDGRPDYRRVDCIDGCSIIPPTETGDEDGEDEDSDNRSDNEKFCDQFRYIPEEDVEGSLLTTLLDSDYISERNLNNPTNEQEGDNQDTGEDGEDTGGD